MMPCAVDGMPQDTKSWDMDRDVDMLLQHIRGQLTGTCWKHRPAEVWPHAIFPVAMLKAQQHARALPCLDRPTRTCVAKRAHV